MKKSYNVISSLLNFIGNNDSISEIEKVKVLVNTFFSKDDNREIPDLNKLRITNIDIEDSTTDAINIKIELGEPGLLVGKDGKTIKQLGGFISKILDKKARIFVQENDEIKIADENFFAK